MERVASDALGFDSHHVGHDAVVVPKDAVDAVTISSLSPEKAALTEEILHDRMLQLNPVKKLGRRLQCQEEKRPSKNPEPPALRLLKKYVPALTWFPEHTRETLQADIIAGITVGIMEVPQSMSYASIAGLEYIYGMYAACIPTFIYGVFGNSRQLAVGPVAMLSLLVEAGLRGTLKDCPGWDPAGEQQQYEVCPTEYARQAMLTAFVVGVMQLVACALQLGFLVSFLGHPVISGFTSGAAVIIGLSQLKYIVGFNIEKSQYVYVTLSQVFSNIHKTKPVPLFLGILWIALLIGNKTLAKKHKRLSILGPTGPLIICFIGMVLVMAFPVLKEDFYVKYVGDIPSGLMPFSFFDLDFSAIPSVLPTAMSACLIGYMESVAIGKNLAAKHGVELDAGQELFALGMANLIGSMFSGYPVTGSFSRSAVNNQTGAKTQLSGMITALVMFATLLFLTPIFYYLPKFALSAIVISSVYQLVSYQEAIHLWRVKRQDFVLWVVAFIGTLLLGVLMGILVAMGLSLAIVISESVRPQLQVLWRIPGTTIYRSMKQESSGVFVPNVLIVRVGASMYFANAAYVKDTILAYIGDLEEASPTEYVVLEMTPVISIDSTAAHCMHDVVQDLRKRGIQVAFAMVGNRVEKTMRKAHLREFVGEQWFFPNVNDAVQYCLCHQRAKRGAALQEDVEKDLLMLPASVHLSNEIGFSNQLHHAWTTVFVTLGKDIPLAAAQERFAAAFRKQKVVVLQAEAEAIEKNMMKQTYFVQTEATQSKLPAWQIEALREEFFDAIDQLSIGEQRVKSLEDALEGERRMTTRLEEELQAQAKRMETLFEGKQGKAARGKGGLISIVPAVATNPAEDRRKPGCGEAMTMLVRSMPWC